MLSKLKILLKNPEFLSQYSNRISNLAKISDSNVSKIQSLFQESKTCWYHVEKCMENPHGSVRMGQERLEILYACVRIFKPKIMIETGVAGGSTSFTILSAMEKNGFGKLYSIDLDDPNYDTRLSNYKIGWIVPDQLKENWTLILGDSKVELPKLLDNLKNIDIFFHDSDHSYEHMMFEFNTVWNHLSEKKVIFSDDINKNNSFDEFISKKNLDSKKFFGFGVAHF